jgi:replicative DNA helicase
MRNRADPPAAPDAERAFLGSVFLDAGLVGRMRETLLPADFSERKYALIYAAMQSVYDRGESVDFVTLTAELEAKSLLDRVGGVTTLSALMMETPTSINAPSYANMITRAAGMRKLISAGAKIANLGYNPDLGLEEAVRSAEDLIAGILRLERGDRFEPQDISLKNFMDELSAKVSGEEGTAYTIPTGLRDLDRMCSGGFRRGDLVVIAARPSMGKTSLMTTIAANMAIKESSVAVFSLEMSTSSLIGRMMATRSGVPLSVINSGRWNDQSAERVGRVYNDLSNAKVWWNDISGMTLERLRNLLRRHSTRYPIDVVCIDHAQLLRSDSRTENRVRELTEITGALKGIAKDYNVPVVLLSQLSRGVLQRPDKIPDLGDLKESGSLEQDADLVLMLHREEFYKPDTDRANIADVFVRKQRNGPTGQVSLSWNPQTTGFWGLEKVGMP